MPISCIKILDLKRDGKSGFAKLKKGGLNQRFAEINFQNKERGCPVHFNVTIFGYAQSRGQRVQPVQPFQRPYTNQNPSLYPQLPQLPQHQHIGWNVPPYRRGN